MDNMYFPPLNIYWTPKFLNQDEEPGKDKNAEITRMFVCLKPGSCFQKLRDLEESWSSGQVKGSLIYFEVRKTTTQRVFVSFRWLWES